RTITKARTNDAGVPIARKPATLRLDLLCCPKSLRSTPFPTIRIRGLPAPPSGARGVESCDRNHGLKSIRDAQPIRPPERKLRLHRHRFFRSVDIHRKYPLPHTAYRKSLISLHSL